MSGAWSPSRSWSKPALQEEKEKVGEPILTQTRECVGDPEKHVLKTWRQTGTAARSQPDAVGVSGSQTRPAGGDSEQQSHQDQQQEGKNLTNAHNHMRRGTG